ncbi:MAG: DUF4381 domain-containing protein [Bdellovibrionales bacterium]|nr:DUF4381 domain-containing protein [Bdellovibrionales bacterium]
MKEPSSAANSPSSANGDPNLLPLPSGPDWSCSFAGDVKEPQTVGALRSLYCTGPGIAAWKKPPHTKFQSSDLEFSLVVVDMLHNSETSADLLVTGYKPGDYKPEVFALVGEEGTVHVKGFSWQTASVLNPNQGQQKPYPPFGPFLFGWPAWIWWGLFAVLFLIFVLLGWRWRKKWTRQRALRKVSSKGYGSPYDLFHKEMRLLLRRYQGQNQVDSRHNPQHYFDRLNEVFREFLTRELSVPALEWSDRPLLRDIRKHHFKVYQKVDPLLSQLLRELSRVKKFDKISYIDCEQLHSMSRQVVDLIYMSRKENS